ASIDRLASLALVDMAKQRSLAAARSLEESAHVAALILHYRDAADDLGNAVTLAGQFDRHEAWRLMIGRAAMLRVPADGIGDNAAVADSVDLSKQALSLVSGDEYAQDWATTQNGRALSLRMLGERKGETKLLEEAVALFRAALEELTRERVPLDWAQTQSNLG